MTEIVDLSWRTYPAALIIAGGLLVIVRATRGAAARSRGLRDPQRTLVVARGLRAVIIGVVMVAVGAAWWAQSAALLGLALVFLGEEMLECAVVIAVLKDGVSREASRRRAVTA